MEEDDEDDRRKDGVRELAGREGRPLLELGVVVCWPQLKHFVNALGRPFELALELSYSDEPEECVKDDPDTEETRGLPGCEGRPMLGLVLVLLSLPHVRHFVNSPPRFSRNAWFDSPVVVPRRDSIGGP